MRGAWLLPIFLSEVLSQECDPRDLKVWFHQDITASFASFAQTAPDFLKTFLSALTNEKRNMDWGYSIFTDRDGNMVPGQKDFCYREAVSFDNDSFEKKFKKVEDLLTRTEIRYDNGDFPEDCMSGIPYVSKQKFGFSNKKDELRLFVIITDSYGKFEPNFHHALSGDKELTTPPEDGITCDVDYVWPTLHQIFEPMKRADVIPVIVSKDYSQYWTQVLIASNVTQYLVHPFEGSVNDAHAVVDAIEVAIDTLICPSTTTTTTTTRTTTSSGDSSATTTGDDTTSSTTEEFTTTTMTYTTSSTGDESSTTSADPYATTDSGQSTEFTDSSTTLKPHSTSNDPLASTTPSPDTTSDDPVINSTTSTLAPSTTPDDPLATTSPGANTTPDDPLISSTTPVPVTTPDDPKVHSTTPVPVTNPDDPLIHSTTRSSVTTPDDPLIHSTTTSTASSTTTTTTYTTTDADDLESSTSPDDKTGSTDYTEVPTNSPAGGSTTAPAPDYPTWAPSDPTWAPAYPTWNPNPEQPTLPPIYYPTLSPWLPPIIPAESKKEYSVAGLAASSWEWRKESGAVGKYDGNSGWPLIYQRKGGW